MAYLQGLCWFTREYPPSHSTPMIVDLGLLDNILYEFLVNCPQFWTSQTWWMRSSTSSSGCTFTVRLRPLSKLTWMDFSTDISPRCSKLQRITVMINFTPEMVLEPANGPKNHWGNTEKTHGVGAGSSCCRLGQCCPHPKTMLSVHFRTFRLYNILCIYIYIHVQLTFHSDGVVDSSSRMCSRCHSINAWRSPKQLQNFQVLGLSCIKRKKQNMVVTQWRKLCGWGSNPVHPMRWLGVGMSKFGVWLTLILSELPLTFFDTFCWGVRWGRQCRWIASTNLPVFNPCAPKYTENTWPTSSVEFFGKFWSTLAVHRELTQWWDRAVKPSTANLG